MKKLTSSVVIAFVALAAASAQALPLKHWGLKTGYTSATQNWEIEFISDDSLSRRSGFHIGVYTEWLDYSNLSLTMGLNYEQKGTGLTSIITDIYGMRQGEKTFYSRLDYLSIPIMAKYTIPAEGAAMYLLAGPRFDIFLGYSKDTGDLVLGIEDEFKDVVLGLSGGLGFERRVSSSWVAFVEFVFNYDPFWLYESTNLQSENKQRIKNQSFNVSIGVGL